MGNVQSSGEFGAAAARPEVADIEAADDVGELDALVQIILGNGFPLAAQSIAIEPPRMTLESDGSRVHFGETINLIRCTKVESDPWMEYGNGIRRTS